MFFNSHQFFKTCKTVHNDSSESLDFVFFDGFLQGLKLTKIAIIPFHIFRNFLNF